MPKKTVTSLSVTPTMHRRVKVVAALTGKTVQEVTAAALDSYLKTVEPKISAKAS